MFYLSQAMQYKQFIYMFRSNSYLGLFFSFLLFCFCNPSNGKKSCSNTKSSKIWIKPFRVNEFHIVLFLMPINLWWCIRQEIGHKIGDSFDLFSLLRIIFIIIQTDTFPIDVDFRAHQHHKLKFIHYTMFNVNFIQTKCKKIHLFYMELSIRLCFYIRR